jgi:ketosteroid isomerase-like protein
MNDEQERVVLTAIDKIIDDFGHHRREAYFSGFAEEATFVFHTSERRLESRAEYEEVWAGWERDNGFAVLECTSTNRRIQLLDEVAIFSHDVETRVRLDGAEELQHERESIIMREVDGQWRCVHEHLSGRD